MSEALEGNLDQLSLPDILRLLIQGKKTGRLSLSNERNSGEVFITGGRIAHAVAGIEDGEAALYDMITWLQGRFRFEPDVQSPYDTMTTETETILRESERRFREMEEIRRFIPDEDALFQISASGSHTAVSLQPQEWQVLAQVNGQRNASDIANVIGMEKLDVLKILARLESGKLLEVAKQSDKVSEPTIGIAFFERLSHEFTDLIGPMGPVIIDEVVAAMGKTRESFPRSQVADLIERISGDIEDDQKRLRFQQIMLDLLREA
jgi:hypothetical protein